MSPSDGDSRLVLLSPENLDRDAQFSQRICEARPLMRPDGEEWGGVRESASYTALPRSEPPPTHPR